MPQDDALRLPRVDRVAAHPRLAEPAARLGAKAVVALIRSALDEVRARPGFGKDAPPGEDEVAATVAARADALLRSKLRRVINATGIVLHTNLGRAPLSVEATQAVAASASGYCALEIDLASGKRGGRGAFVLAALRSLTGAEAALVVNNCAAAVLLLLATVARGRAVVVSRGELVEIGGGFRVPEIMAESGARLVEIGTTNKTRLADYERAIDGHPDCAAILRVHQSNFRQIGFVERPELADLASLAARRGLPLLEDLGAGALVDLSGAGLAGEPTVAASIAAGASAVAFSTDKLLGGPQGGAVVGDAAIVERMRRHPLARALRLGRLATVALEATLSAYLEGRAYAGVPVLAAAHAPLADVTGRAERWAEALRARGAHARVLASTAEMGGGATPGRAIPSAAVALAPGAGRSVDEVVAALRGGEPAVLARVEAGEIVVDARTVLPGEDDMLLEALGRGLCL